MRFLEEIIRTVYVYDRTDFFYIMDIDRSQLWNLRYFTATNKLLLKTP